MDPWFLVVVLAATAVALACAYAELWKEHQALQAKSRQAPQRSPGPVQSACVSRLAASKRKCYDRLDRLGFRSLEEYHRSEQWWQTKQRYRNSDYPQRCLVCDSPQFDLHHRTYERLGEEELFDLVPLCQGHHERLHELLDDDPQLCVKDTHDYLVFLLDKKVVPGESEIPF